jgi:hypothetical protein
MIRLTLALSVSLMLAGCHTTDFGRSVGWPSPSTAYP